MKTLLIALLLLSCVSAGAEESSWRTVTGDLFLNKDDEIVMFVDTTSPAKVYYPSKNVKEETLGKIYSMIADIHIKEMGIDRYNQIYDPTNEGEVAKQKRHEKEQTQELCDRINSYIKSGKQIEIKPKDTQ